MKLPQLIGLLSIVLNLTAFGQTLDSKSTTKDTEEWKSSIENNYTIHYPSSWVLDKSGKLGTSFVLSSPASSEQDPFKENVNLFIQDIEGLNLDLDKYAGISINQIKKMANTPEVIENKKVANNTSTYQKVIYTAKQGDFLLKFEQYYWVKNNKAYVLTLTCEEDQFDTFKMTGEKILNSFKIN